MTGGLIIFSGKVQFLSEAFNANLYPAEIINPPHFLSSIPNPAQNWMLVHNPIVGGVLRAHKISAHQEKSSFFPGRLFSCGPNSFLFGYHSLPFPSSIFSPWPRSQGTLLLQPGLLDASLPCPDTHPQAWGALHREK